MVNIERLAGIKEPICSKYVMSHVDAISIFKKYMPFDFVINAPMRSPLPFRKDNIPSFGIYYNREGKLLYNDFVYGGGNCIRFVKEMFRYKTWYEACSRIARDFEFDNHYITKKPDINDKHISNKREYSFEIKDKVLEVNTKTRKFLEHDRKYWSSYGISLKTLLDYRVYCISHIFLINKEKERVFKAEKHAYAFIEYKDAKITQKIYQPFSKYKWMNSHNSSVWQGWTQLPETGHTLIITKSLKDSMSIRENTEFYSVALQSESTSPKETVIQDLIQRFDWVFVLYDNDYDKKENWGRKFAEKLTSKYRYLHNIIIPDEYKSKDFTDLYKAKGNEFAVKTINELVRKKIKTYAH